MNTINGSHVEYSCSGTHYIDDPSNSVFECTNNASGVSWSPPKLPTCFRGSFQPLSFFLAFKYFFNLKINFLGCGEKPVVPNSNGGFPYKSDSLSVEGKPTHYKQQATIVYACDRNYATLHTRVTCGFNGRWWPRVVCVPSLNHF